jgi:hypothetical protein
VAPVEEAQGEVVGGVEAVGSNGLTESVNAMRAQAFLDANL